MIRNVPSGKTPLFINMDETSVGLAYPGQKGNVAQKVRTTRPRPGTYTEKASLSVRRGNITYCAFIASDTNVQRLLPQILLGNQKRFTRKILRAAWQDQPPFVQTWTAESGWVNHNIMKKIITVLHNCIQEITAEYQIILVVDAARCHIHRDIVNHACRHDMWMLYVPAKMTWLLQPLDAYVFAGFKAHLKQQYADPHYTPEATSMPTINWLRRLWTSIEHKVHNMDWKHAFAKVGLMNQQRDMSAHVAACTAMNSPGTFGCAMPSPGDLQYLLGDQIVVPHSQLTRPVLMRSTGALAHLWPGALPRRSEHSTSSSISATTPRHFSVDITSALATPEAPPAPWPRAIRMGQKMAAARSRNDLETVVLNDTASQMSQETNTQTKTDTEIPRASRMWPPRSRRQEQCPEAKKEGPKVTIPTSPKL